MTTIDENSIIKSLSDIGLSGHEIEIYLCLLKVGSSSAATISKLVSIKRTTTYAILERLIEKGVVTAYDQSSKRIFTPLQPHKLKNLYESRIESLINIIPALEKLKNTDTKEYGVRFIQSKKELEAVYENILNEYAGDEYYIIGSVPAFINIDRKFFLEFRKRRAARKTRTKLLLSADSKDEEGQNDPNLLRQFKYLPEKYKFKSTIDIYRDKIIIVGPEVKALALIIAIPPMVDIFRSVFEALWESTK